MKVHTLLISTMLLCSCSALSMPGNNLIDGVSRSVPLSSVNVSIERLSFIEAGQKCAEMRGYPKHLHPWIVLIFGCAQTYIRNDGTVYACEVILGTDDKSILAHELRHCRGFDD